MKIKNKLESDFASKLEKNIAGENINWNMFERYLEIAKPKTFGTIMRVAKSDAYMKASGFVGMSPRTKLIIIVGGAIAIGICMIIIVLRSMGTIDLGI